MVIRRVHDHDAASSSLPQQQQQQQATSSSKSSSSVTNKNRGNVKRREILAVCIGLAIGFVLNSMLVSWAFAHDSEKESASSSSHYGITPVLYQHEEQQQRQRKMSIGQMHDSTSSATSKRQPYRNNHAFQREKRSLVNMTGVTARAFEYWPKDVPLPCFHAPDKTEEERAKVHRERGLLFLKPVKVGSSTALGVNLRIAEHEAQRQKKAFQRCTATHGHAMGHYFHRRNLTESFLWSMLREPTDRVVSEFFHFIVSREKVEPSTENFKQYMRTGKINAVDYYIKLHATSFPAGKHKRMIANIVPAILKDYNFIGITERFEESMVVLQLLLRLPTSDILYLNAKQAGNFDDGGYKNTCYYIVPSFVSPQMKRYFEDPHGEFFKMTEKDYALYYAVNASLDATIDQTIGRDKFDAALKKFRHAQRIINEECGGVYQAKFPCTPEGVKMKDEDTDCYHKDSGCGISCINRVVAERGL